MKRFVAFALIAALLISCTRADSWLPPSPLVAASPDGATLLRITPGSPGKEGAKARATVLKYDAATGGYRKTVEFPLRNSVSPHEAVITNDAQYIVTFDDWGLIGASENVVVIYRSTGEFVRAWTLAEIFTEREREAFVYTSSSIWWRGHVKVLQFRTQPPQVIISPQTDMGIFEKAPKRDTTVTFDLATMTFQKQ